MKIENLCLLLFMFGCTPAKNEITGNSTSNTAIIPSNAYCFLDGEEIPMKVVGEGLSSDKIEYVNWSNGTRDALLRFGEKYRGGIYVFKTKVDEK